MGNSMKKAAKGVPKVARHESVGMSSKRRDVISPEKTETSTMSDERRIRFAEYPKNRNNNGQGQQLVTTPEDMQYLRTLRELNQEEREEYMKNVERLRHEQETQEKQLRDQREYSEEREAHMKEQSVRAFSTAEKIIQVRQKQRQQEENKEERKAKQEEEEKMGDDVLRQIYKITDSIETVEVETPTPPPEIKAYLMAEKARAKFRHEWPKHMQHISRESEAEMKMMVKEKFHRYDPNKFVEGTFTLKQYSELCNEISQLFVRCGGPDRMKQDPTLRQQLDQIIEQFCKATQIDVPTMRQILSTCNSPFLHSVGTEFVYGFWYAPVMGSERGGKDSSVKKPELKQ